MKRQIICFIILIFLSISSFGCAYIFKSNPEQEKQERETLNQLAQERIKQNDKLKILDNLCNELPKPKDFDFIGKDAGNNILYVDYRYKTSFNYDQVKNFYEEFFNQNGWIFFEERRNWGRWFEYRKEGKSIHITIFSGGESSLSCGYGN